MKLSFCWRNGKLSQVQELHFYLWLIEYAPQNPLRIIAIGTVEFINFHNDALLWLVNILEPISTESVSTLKVKYGSMIAMLQINAFLSIKDQNVGVKIIKKKSGRMEPFSLVEIIPTIILISKMIFSPSTLTVPMTWTWLYLTRGIKFSQLTHFCNQLYNVFLWTIRGNGRDTYCYFLEIH